MWDERCRFKLFCAWGGIQWRKCYFNHLTETVLVGFCRFNEFLQRECSQHFLNPDFPSRRLSLWGLSEGKWGAVLAFVNETLRHFCEWGHLQIPCFTGCICCPELPRTSVSELWMGLLPSKARCFGNCLPSSDYSLFPYQAMLAASLQ